MTRTQAVGSRIKASLKALDWSQEQLADRVTELGVPMERNVVANIVNGRRSYVSVDEAVAFALALDVPLPLLLCDPENEDPVELTPEREARPWEALKWLAGDRALEGQDEDRWKQNSRNWRIYGRLFGASERVLMQAEQYYTAEEMGGPMQASLEMYRHACESLEAAQEAADEAGLPTDGFLRDSVVRSMERLDAKLQREGLWHNREEL